jgi:serine/threonine protein kinase/tetratricopeptide (TPR) repeat protein
VDQDRFKKLREIFDRAIELEGESREDYLNQACADDPELREEIVGLLSEDADPASLLPTLEETIVSKPVGTGGSLPGGVFRPSMPTEIGPYKILRKLGEGGMGIVYEAEQEIPVRRRVALKVIKHNIDSEQVLGRFETERQALAMMNHPCIAKVLDAGTSEDGRPYFVMELIHGLRINEYCDRNRLNPDQRVELMIQVCAGVQHAHQKGVIHRDLKPENILVEVSDDKPLPRIIDFGVAKATNALLFAEQAFTQIGQMIGTPEYMSPEQADLTELDIDTRTDVYALGVILYELLIGRLPFDSKDLRSAGFKEIRRIIREDTPHKPSTRYSSIDEGAGRIAARRSVDRGSLLRSCRGDLDWITMKALEKDRTHRYGSASDLGLDLSRHLKNEPVLAGPPTVGYRVKKFIRRNRVAVSTSAAVGLALVLGLVGTSYGMIRATRAERQALLEVATTGRVMDFMLEMFNINDPGEARGNTITAREILDRGTDRIREDLSDEPELQSRLMDSMGRVYRSLGLFGAAEPLLREAVSSAEEAWGVDAPQVASALNRLAGMIILRGAADEAMPLLERALSIQTGALSPNDPELARTYNNLGGVYYRARDFEPALENFERALAIRAEALGENDPAYARTLKNVGHLQMQLERWDEAELSLRKVLELREQELGNDHVDVAKGLSSLAELYRKRGDYEASLRAIDRMQEIRNRVLPEHHPAKLRGWVNRGMAEQESGKTEAAIASFEAARKEAEALGRTVAQDRVLQLGMRRLLDLYTQAGDTERAAEIELLL